MSGITRGLAQIEQMMNKANEKYEDREPAKWLKLNDGESVKITFLQEIDADSPNYNDAAGQVFVAAEHSSPADYRRKALCTVDDGGCYGCEQHSKNPKEGWKARGRLYANVLVDDGKNDPYVAILSQGLSGKSITPTLLMFASDSNSVTSNAFRIKRSGTGTSTEYSLVPVMNSEGVDPTDYTLYDLEKIVTRYIPYADQAEFYGGTQQTDAHQTVESDALSW